MAERRAAFERLEKMCKYIPDLDESRDILKELSTFPAVVSIDKNKIIASLDNYNFTDIEDCLQTECAKDFLADYIITRNIKDFQNSEVPAILPNEFLKKLNLID